MAADVFSVSKGHFLMCIFSDVENVQDGLNMYHEDGRGGEEHLIKTFQWLQIQSDVHCLESFAAKHQNSIQ